MNIYCEEPLVFYQEETLIGNPKGQKEKKNTMFLDINAAGGIWETWI